jgi:hypothetical protein
MASPSCRNGLAATGRDDAEALEVQVKTEIVIVVLAVVFMADSVNCSR